MKTAPPLPETGAPPRPAWSHLSERSGPPPGREELLDRYRRTRARSLELCEPLEPEDYRAQPVEHVSPPWWNLGHTSWFFAKNVLEPFSGEYGEGDSALEFVLNSYYVALGPRLARGRRGDVTRPTTDRVYRFRASVDERMERLLRECPEEDWPEIAFLVGVGLQHEQQHQELLLTEVKYILGFNPRELREPYVEHRDAERGGEVPEPAFVPFEGGVHEFGNVEGGWCWDNELPVHKAYLRDFALMNRTVTVGEYLEFMEDGGYRETLLWLANGWAAVEREGWEAPLYWERVDGEWELWTLSGTRAPDPDEPVCHLSFYEADAFARWKSEQGDGFEGCRLPTEREWEHAARSTRFDPEAGNTLEAGRYHPLPLRASPGTPSLPTRMAGDLWEWTSSHYEPYPGFSPFEGDITEYNGKWMDNQRVLRGGSCATPADHIRLSYRNFWPADTRFQFTGLRLAKDLG